MPRKSKQIEQRAVVTPIYQSSTFIFPDTASLVDYQKGKRKGYMYSRSGNPTVEAVEDDLSRLDGAERSLLFSSGMAAISTACLTLLRTGDEIISSFPVYGGTAALFEKLLKGLGIRTRFFPATDVSELGRIVSEKTRLVYLESPTNPDLKIVDLDAVVRIARNTKAFSIIDSTFATPVNQRPLEFGLDAVIHSASKYLGGHSDIIGGVVSGREVFISRVRKTRDYLGGCPDPHQAYLLSRGLKTLELRMMKHNSSAAAIAAFLAGKKMLKKVNYPGLASHPQHELARRQMTGFGGIISFDLGSAGKAVKFVDSLRVILNAASLGGTESLISIPVWSSHFGLKKKELARYGIGRGLVRLSVGLEEEEVLIRDLERALKLAAGY
jgi:cystathionine beta-lyase/cystathionine gamma-synthase